MYFCCLEALQNVAKHAGPGTPVHICLRTEGEGLHFEISDEGPGFERGRTAAGHGLTTMGDRIGAVGGTFAVTSKLGAGTRVVGFVPPP